MEDGAGLSAASVMLPLEDGLQVSDIHVSCVEDATAAALSRNSTEQGMTLHCFMSLQSLTLSLSWCCPQAAEITGPPRAKPVGKTPAFLATVRTTVDQLRQVG